MSQRDKPLRNLPRVGFIDWLIGLRRIIQSLDERWLNPNRVMAGIWSLRAVIQDVQLEMAILSEAVDPEGLANDAAKQFWCANATSIV